MSTNPLEISLDTLLAASPLLGHPLEDRTPIREAQDRQLIDRWRNASSVRLRGASQQNLFCVAPLDLLVSNEQGQKQFHLLELNGTGIGGLTNLTEDALGPILDGMGQIASAPATADPLILVASSGKESETNPRLNKLIHEKLMYADAIKRGFQQRGESATVTVMSQLAASSECPRSGPLIVVGYIKEFLDHLETDQDNRLMLLGREVTGAVNDRFFMNVHDHFDGRVNLARLTIMNRCFLAGADKGIAYDLLNDFLRSQPKSQFPSGTDFNVCCCREELTETVFAWLRRGLRPVIKPHGTGLGHGIEFFLSADEPDASILKRIDGSIRLTEEYYRAKGGAFPYTVCEYVNADRIDRPGHRLQGHKYELRVVVYRDGMTLQALPSIVKVACEPCGQDGDGKHGLINNITASCVRTQAKGTDYMFPLANRETLALFGLTEQDITALCRGATGYVRYVLDQVEDQPARLGLPDARRKTVAA